MKCVACNLAFEGCNHNCMDGFGSWDAPLLQVGEAPGKMEDDPRYGRPFVGPAGRELEKWNSRFLPGVKIRKTNANRCRPRGNRTPTDYEIMACRPHLMMEISKMKSLRLIMALGGCAARSLIGVRNVAKVRGMIHKDVGSVPYGVGVIVTYHPSFLLKNRNRKDVLDAVKEDFCLAADYLGIGEASRGVSVRFLRTTKDVREWLYHLHQHVLANPGAAISLDTETGTMSPWDPPSVYWPKGPCVLTIQMCVDGNEVGVIPMEHPQSPFGPGGLKKVRSLLGRFFDAVGKLKRKPVFNAHNWKYDAVYLLVKEGIDLRKFPMDDTMLMHASLTQTEHHSLSDLAHLHRLGNYDVPLKRLARSNPAVGIGVNKPFSKRGSYGNVPLDMLVDYGGRDCLACHRLREVLLPEIKKKRLVYPYHIDGRTRVVSLWYDYRHVKCEGVRTLMEIELAGFCVDLEYNRKLRERLESDLKMRMERIRQYSEVRRFEREMLKQFYNPDSNEQTARFIFDFLGMEDPSYDQSRSVAKEWMDVLALEGPDVVKEIAEYRKQSGLLSKSVEPMYSRWLGTDGKIHSSYNVHIARTGRSSSGGTCNMQQIPRDKEFKRQFIPRPGNVLVYFDLSQIELRIVAHLSRDKKWIDAYIAGVDLHRYVSAHESGKLENCPFSLEDNPEELDRWLKENVSDEERQEAKWLDFRLNYGTGPKGYADELNRSIAFRASGKKISVEEARKRIERYYGKFPGIARYHDWIFRFTMRHGYTPGLYMGWRTFNIPDKDGPNRDKMISAIRRYSINYPPQNAGWVVLLLGMNRIRRMIGRCGLRTRMVVTVHDSLGLDMPPEELELIPIFVDILENPLPEDMPFGRWRVPIRVDVEAGYNWGDLRPVDQFLREEFGMEFRRVAYEAGTPKEWSPPKEGKEWNSRSAKSH